MVLWHMPCFFTGMSLHRYHQIAGKRGEDLAVRELQRRGYSILARRYRTRFGELDIVAEDGPVTVFVEVKARASSRFGGAAEAIPFWKQRRLAAMALDYLAWSNRTNRACRFDVVAIDGLGSPGMQIRVVQDAFWATAYR